MFSAIYIILTYIYIKIIKVMGFVVAVVDICIVCTRISLSKQVENFVEDESNRFILDINIVQSKSS
jgi:hypothetical protein